LTEDTVSRNFRLPWKRFPSFSEVCEVNSRVKLKGEAQSASSPVTETISQIYTFYPLKHHTVFTPQTSIRPKFTQCHPTRAHCGLQKNSLLWPHEGF
jgi:hypothetical protein